jgi:hypothetical protein
MLMRKTEELMEGNEQGYLDLDGILGDWEKTPRELVHVAISEDEPIIHVGKRHRGVKLISEGHPPLYINVTNLGMITDHFVDNAINHTDGPNGITLLQTSKGVHVMDTGTGISPHRLSVIERRVRWGKTVLSDREGGGGSGFRDSVALLGKISNEGNHHAAITIASKEGAGTISSITWGNASDETTNETTKPNIVPEGWHYVQFVLEGDGGKVTERSGSDSLPRPISDVFERYDRFGKGVGIHG